jgi:predicted transcriptional regulator
MRLTEKQKAVLLALTNGWQAPTQIASKIGYYTASYVNLPLKILIREGLAEKKPDVRGQYRLTPFGAYTKSKVAHETHR